MGTLYWFEMEIDWNIEVSGALKVLKYRRGVILAS